jgi:hypothetical protein
MRTLATLVGAATVAGGALLTFALAVERAPEPCKPGHVRAIVQEAGSCLGDYKNRVANEPIAFCTVRREVCMPTVTAPADTPAAPESAQP